MGIPSICFLDYYINRDFLKHINYPIFLNLNLKKIDDSF